MPRREIMTGLPGNLDFFSQPCILRHQILQWKSTPTINGLERHWFDIDERLSSLTLEFPAKFQIPEIQHKLD